jgi:hypothetical protein
MTSSDELGAEGACTVNAPYLVGWSGASCASSWTSMDALKDKPEKEIARLLRRDRLQPAR